MTRWVQWAQHSVSCLPWLQSLTVVNKALFQNCLAAMRPNTKPNDLPLTHDVTTYLHNSFIKWIESLKDWIQVCTHLFSYFIPFLLSFHRRQLLVGSQLWLTFGLLTRQRHLSWVLQPIGSRVRNLENGRYMVRSLCFKCILVRILVDILSGCASELVSSRARIPRCTNKFSLLYLILMLLFSFFVSPQTIQAATTQHATTLNPPSSPAKFTPSILTNIASCASHTLSTLPSPLLWALSLKFPTRLWLPSGSSIWPYPKTMSKAPTSTLSPPFKCLSSRSSHLGNVSRTSTISSVSAELTHPSRSHSTAMCIGAWLMECLPVLMLYERYVQLMKRFQVFTYVLPNSLSTSSSSSQTNSLVQSLHSGDPVNPSNTFHGCHSPSRHRTGSMSTTHE